MSGGKGGSSTTEVKIPEYIEAAAQRNLNKAERISQLGYVPQYGPDVAAFTPMQQASFQNTANAANAFGMAAPTSQRDIMGGMDAPTTYAGGVQGYSSAPMYQQSIDALAAARPAQKSYIDSFFIDPTTGNYAYQPMDYTQYATNAANDRAAAAVANEGGGGPDAGPAGYGGDSTTSINTPMSYMPGGVNDPFLTSPISQGIAGLSTPAGMTQQADGSYVNTGSLAPTTSARPVARPSDLGSGNDSGAGGFSTGIGNSISDASVAMGGTGFGAGASGFFGDEQGPNGTDSGAGGGGGGKVICTALHELGRLSDDVYALDAAFGLRVNSEDPMLGDGYRLWATSVANYIKGDSVGSKVALAIVSPVAKAWAAEMAHVMRPDDYKSNIFGKALMAVGHPICRMIGKVFLPKMKTEIV